MYFRKFMSLRLLCSLFILNFLVGCLAIYSRAGTIYWITCSAEKVVIVPKKGGSKISVNGVRVPGRHILEIGGKPQTAYKYIPTFNSSPLRANFNFLEVGYSIFVSDTGLPSPDRIVKLIKFESETTTEERCTFEVIFA